jgi:GAF domain-containing protein
MTILDDKGMNLKREVTELRRQLDEAHAQQAASAEILQVINSSPGDLAPVFDTILEKALSLCEGAFGSLARFDGDAFEWVATRGVPDVWFAEFRSSGYRPTPGLALYRFQHGGEDIEHVADIAADESGRSAIPDRRRFAELTGARTAIWIALRKDGALRGALVIYRREVRPFTDKQIALLQNFAAQAVIAMENARLITETREALEQQTATAEVLRVINSSPGDLAPVFDAMLEKALRLCEASFGVLSRIEGDQFHAITVRGAPSALAEALRQPRPLMPGNSHYRLAHGEDVVQVEDITDTDVYRSGNAPRRALADVGGARTVLWIALRKDGPALGAFVVYRQEVRPFSDKQIALLRNFAAQAVIAMENARLLGDLRERTGELEESLEYQTATSDVLKVISRSTFDLQPVLDTLVETATRLCNADFGNLFRRDGGGFRRAAVFGLTPEMWRDELLEVTRGSIVGRVVLEVGIVHVNDVAADPEYMLPTVQLAGVRSSLGVPLLREGEPIGVFTLGRRRVEPFTERQIELVRTFADQAVIAVENARLLGELRQRTDEVAELNRGLEARVAEQVDELGRVGRLKRFLAPQLAEMIVSQGDEKILESHRREIVVVFCDLRGYTAFTETAEPEEVLDFLREYHGALGPLVSQFEGTLDQFSGDGIMVFFNDPVPCPNPAERAVKMAMAMREAAGALIADWRERGRDLGFGAGIAQGYATLGQIGFTDRSGYTAIGTVCNVAARLCAEAKDGQILLGQRVNVALKGSVATEQLGALALKGLTQPVVAYNVPVAATQPALRVIEDGPQHV